MDYNEKDLKIVRVNNIYDFDFDGELGARFGGRDFLIPAGGSLLTPLSIGEHLAKHLAQANLLRKFENRIPQPGDDLKKLWDDATIEKAMKEILTDEMTEARRPVKSQDDITEEKIKELNKVKDEGEDVETPEVSEETTEETTEKVAYKDKAQVIAELKKRNITFDSRAPKATLEALLK